MAEGPWAGSPTDMLPWDAQNLVLSGLSLAWNTFKDFWGHKVKDFVHELEALSNGPVV